MKDKHKKELWGTIGETKFTPEQRVMLYSTIGPVIPAIDNGKRVWQVETDYGYRIKVEPAWERDQRLKLGTFETNDTLSVEKELGDESGSENVGVVEFLKEDTE